MILSSVCRLLNQRESILHYFRQLPRKRSVHKPDNRRTVVAFHKRRDRAVPHDPIVDHGKYLVSIIPTYDVDIIG